MTVKELISVLKKCNQDAKVTNFDNEEFDTVYEEKMFFFHSKQADTITVKIE